ncbi:MAG: hypothetical protein H0W12_08375 [Chitinophagaceae bacterium]|nr:hypothetical protein [Chitinophagaceae bacterium]
MKDMQSSNLLKASLLCGVILLLSFSCWELYLRGQGITATYDDGKELWSDKRAMVYEPSDKATVFIGASRNKYDIDQATWISLTGDHPIQLAMEGNSPLPVLDDLAKDKNFKGKLIIDVTEGLFFTTSPNNTSEPKERIAYYKKQTPAQWFSFRVNHVLESKFVFLDKDNFSLNALLGKIKVHNRSGVFAFPDFPMEFQEVTFNRQNFMTDKFLTDTTLQNKVKNIWDFFRSINKEPPMSGVKLDSVLLAVKEDCDKIKGRGGQVIFVRTPSSGPYLAGKKMGFPRQKYWDRLLATTGCPGIHFEDYPAIAHFQCPEFSHLKTSDAIVFTKNLINILENEKGWKFPRK